MFEFERRTNLGSLVMAVLVGLLPLVSNQYVKVKPETLLSALPKTSEKNTNNEEMFPPSGVEKLRADIKSVDALLSQPFSAYTVGRRTRYDPRLLRGIAAVRPYADRIDEICQEFNLIEQTTVLRLLFMAAQLQQETFRPAFVTLCSHIEDKGDQKTTAQAGVLRFYHEQDLSQPNLKELVQALDRFSATHRDPIPEIHLYSIISQGLWRAGHSNDAQEILQRGIRRFKGQPGVSHLVNQMIDQRTPSRLANPPQ